MRKRKPDPWWEGKAPKHQRPGYTEKKTKLAPGNHIKNGAWYGIGGTNARSQRDKTEER